MCIGVTPYASYTMPQIRLAELLNAIISNSQFDDNLRMPSSIRTSQSKVWSSFLAASGEIICAGVMSAELHPLLTQIMSSLRLRYRFLNPRYEAGWTESWTHRRCLHEHATLIEAA
jgi:hypothetical protein